METLMPESRTSLLSGWLLAVTMLIGTAPAQSVRFDQDIQTVLAQRCLTCHGSGEAEAGLTLTSRAGALRKLDSGRAAIVPGHPDDSELLRRVTSADADERMPPKGEPLTAAQIAALRQWIAEGAEWPEHWAYRSLQQPPVPAPQDESTRDWIRNPVDAFIAAEHQRQGLIRAPEADRRTLLRRLSFDLTGLPPSLDELRDFERDTRPEAYERVVERLLASPRFGERQARHWMDLVHFAETHGQDQDRIREHAWPYRDWLIQAFNADLPYSRFAAAQIAGDVLWPHDPQALTATGLLAAGPWDESSLRDIREDSPDREVARYLDRDDIVTTVMNTFVSTTVHCARCHEHKFDPVSQPDYYALQAVFAATGKGNRRYDADPATGARRRALQAELASLPARKAAGDPALLPEERRAAVRQFEAAARNAALAWRILDLTDVRSEGGAELTRLPDGSVLSGGPKPEKDTTIFTGSTSLTVITGLRLEVLTHESLAHQGPGRQDNGNLHLNELKVFVAPRNRPDERREVTLARPQADFNQTGWSIEMALDRNPGTAWGIHPEVGKPHRAVFEFQEPLREASSLLITVQLEQTHGGSHLIGRARLSLTGTPAPLPLDVETLPEAIVRILDQPEPERSNAQWLELSTFVLEKELNRDLQMLPPQQLVYCGSNQFEPDGGFRPVTQPRPVSVLKRGLVTDPLEPAVPGTLGMFPELASRFDLPDPNDEGARRAALARWIVDRRNVLTWRSIANRIWQSHFGRGLVDTPSDFGRMGSVPTHPELLEYLTFALRNGFRPEEDPAAADGGIPSLGAMKALHRLIVASATYRQSSRHDPAMAARDADNRYLWRMPRTRLDAESVRDAVLMASDRLDRRMGGPSDRQFVLKPGIHVTPLVDYQNFDPDAPANHRRSVYRFLFRTLPDPFMETLDCPDASQLTPVRTASVTPLQALAMLNDKLIVRQSEHLAGHSDVRDSLPAAQIRVLLERILLRAPTPDEDRILREYAAEHGLANAARLLFNTNEFLFVD